MGDGVHRRQALIARAGIEGAESSDDPTAKEWRDSSTGWISILYDGIVVCPDPRRKVVLVLSYADAPDDIRPTHVETLSKIDWTREDLESLKSNYPALAVALKDATVRFEFCRDYGKGAVALAWLDGAELKWAGGGSGSR
jgi:hypothetical protein